MTDLRYTEIEEQLVEALPELAPAAAYYWHTEGSPGSDSGPYIFFEDVFGTYVKVLLILPTSPRRDELLRRAFSFVESMLACSDVLVRDLAFIGFFEGRENWLFARSKPFLGTVTRAVLDARWSGWRGLADELTEQAGDRLLDGYRVRHVIAEELHDDGVVLDRVPGRTYAQDERSA